MRSSQGSRPRFPGVPHRYCVNHFMRDLAKPMLEADSHAKVKMRRKVRGLRAIERAVLQQRRRRATVERPATVRVLRAIDRAVWQHRRRRPSAPPAVAPAPTTPATPPPANQVAKDVLAATDPPADAGSD